MTTLFNGASSVAQAGGMAVLANMKPIEDIVAYYMENARLVREVVPCAYLSLPLTSRPSATYRTLDSPSKHKTPTTQYPIWLPCGGHEGAGAGHEEGCTGSGHGDSDGRLAEYAD